MNSKVKYRNLTDNISTALTFYVFSIVLEYLGSFLIMGQMPIIIIGSIFVIHIFAFVIFLLPTSVLRKGIAILLLMLQCVITLVNEVLYRTTAELFTIDKLALMDAALGERGVFTISMIRWEVIFLFLFIFVLAIVVMLNVSKFIRAFRPTVKAFISIILLVITSIMFIFYGLLVSVAKDTDSYNILLSQFPVSSTYKIFGYYPMYTLNLITGLDSLFAISGVNVEGYVEYIKEGANAPTNSYTGVSSDNDVILILAESLDVCGIDKYFTPNLYNLVYNEPNAMYMSEYYSENKTNMSEGLSFLGTYSRAKPLANMGNNLLCSALDNVSLPSLLKQTDDSITTSYYHCIDGSFYSRETTFDRLGFDSLVFAANQKDEIDDYNIANNQYYDWNPLEFYEFIKDSNFIEYNIESFIPNEGRMFTMFSTISTHGYYNLREDIKDDYTYLMSSANDTYRNNMILDLQNAGYHPENVMSSFLYYKAGMMEFDRTMGIIKDRLIETGRLDNTTILIYADHNAYYDNLSWRLRGISDNKVDECNIEAYNMPCIIYDKGLTEFYRSKEGIMDTTHTIDCDRFMSSMDIYPTLCNILGLNYNTRLCYGVSVFDNTPHVFMTFKDSGYIFDKNFYYADGKIYPIGSTTDSAYFKALVDDMLYKFKVQETLYRSTRTLLEVFESDDSN